jgi:hypothetical protein
MVVWTRLIVTVPRDGITVLYVRRVRSRERVRPGTDTQRPGRMLEGDVRGDVRGVRSEARSDVRMWMLMMMTRMAMTTTMIIFCITLIIIITH